MNILEQIEALTQELSPYPTEEKSYYYLGSDLQIYHIDCISKYFIPFWRHSLFASTNKAEVEEYADCYKRLKLYQLLGKKRKKEFPIKWNSDVYDITSAEQQDAIFYGTDFGIEDEPYTMFGRCPCYRHSTVLGGVWFSREEDRLEALKICGIDAEFQKRCAKYGLGGA
jgi:hypothetical protein